MSCAALARIAERSASSVTSAERASRFELIVCTAVSPLQRRLDYEEGQGRHGLDIVAKCEDKGEARE